jgi:hypothetical protein
MMKRLDMGPSLTFYFAAMIWVAAAHVEPVICGAAAHAEPGTT